jgi:hypothetical protein
MLRVQFATACRPVRADRPTGSGGTVSYASVAARSRSSSASTRTGSARTALATCRCSHPHRQRRVVIEDGEGVLVRFLVTDVEDRARPTLRAQPREGIPLRRGADRNKVDDFDPLHVAHPVAQPAHGGGDRRPCRLRGRRMAVVHGQRRSLVLDDEPRQVPDRGVQ